MYIGYPKRAIGMIMVGLGASLLCGCASTKVLKPIPSVIPPSQPLEPVAVYLPDCGEISQASKKTAAYDVGSLMSCLGMWSAVSKQFPSASKDVMVLKSMVSNDENKHPLGVIPNLAKERKFAARYRVVVRAPASFKRMVYSNSLDGYSSSHKKKTTRVSFVIVDTESGKRIGSSGFELGGANKFTGIMIIKKLARGIHGPRCKSYPKREAYSGLNPFKAAKLSLRAHAPDCDTFSLPMDPNQIRVYEASD